ncbi:radical SAM protein [Lacrimispora sp.]|uniref:radical SAM protein n=1 Tax=Lacrimispora sp. TaxID=2719234 RepID=UPI0028A606AC|nr:radical SAM protein [Lacrimispora sp.]
MKILVLTHLDATNYSIANIVKILKNNNHYVEGYGRFTDFHNIKMFEGMLEINPIEELMDEHIYEFDVIFCALDVINRVRYIEKYIFCYNFLFCGNLISDCGDFMFTQCDNRRLDYEEECASMAIGNPKISKRPYVTEENKQILFIDSGHYPFGREGRIMLAELLVKICEQHLDYKLVIKPRFLPNDTNVTHRNDYHLYTVIEELTEENIPSNLIMLDEHRDMNELIDASDLVLCLYTTAYIDAAIRHKKLIIIDGLPNDDTFDIRNNYHWKKQRQVLEESGCMCHYSEVLNHIPVGFICKQEHINNVVKYEDGASERAAETMEFLWEKYLQFDKFPVIQRYNFDNLSQDIHIDNNLDWNDLIVKRYKNILRFSSRHVDYVDKDIFKKEYMLMFDDFEQKGLISRYTYHEIQKLANTFKNELWIRNSEILMDEAINQSFLLLAMFENHHYDAIKKVEYKDILCESHYCYIMGRVCFDESNYEEAIKYLQNFLTISRERGYTKYLSDREDRQISAEFHIGLSSFRIGDWKRAYEQFMICKNLTNNNHKKADEYLDLIKKRWAEYRENKRLTKLHFEVHLAEHCNLNCKSCSHFSPLAKPEFMDINVFKKDMERLSIITKQDVERIELLGGEPLLNPDITEYFDITRRNFPDTTIMLLTNGLLLSQQHVEFWESCRNNKVRISVTKYPINFDYNRMEQLIKNNHVEFGYWMKSDEKQKEFWHMHLDLNGKQNAEYSFSRCTWGGGCIALKEGKLYPCVMIAYIQHFNSYFNKNLPITENDYIDIYEAAEINEIFDKLVSVPDFCRFCTFDNGQRVYNTEFGISKKEILEWT